MAQLKDLIVNGASRLIGDAFTNKIQITTVNAPTTSGGSTYGPGSSGQVLKTNGTSIYWDSAGGAGTVTQVTAGTGLKIGTASSGGTITTTGTINHINSVTAQTTQAVYPIKIDAQGHISAYGSAVTSMPASDVYSWAKASSKPTYTASEVGALASNTTYVSTITTTAGAHTAISSKSGAVSFNVPTTAAHVGAATSDHVHGNITNGGDITATAPTIANGDQIVINDASASKITNGPTFDGSTTTKALTPKGTWETFLKSYTESDPVFSASAAAGITSSDITNWNGKTSNTGTVTKVTAGTGLKIGTASSGGDITTSGTINHINSVTAQTTQAVYPIKIDAQGHISAYGTAVTIVNTRGTATSGGTTLSVVNTGDMYTWNNKQNKATTLAGYGITDAKISNGTITLGSNTITPLTSFTETDPVFVASAAHGITSSDITNWNGKVSSTTTAKIFVQSATPTGMSAGDIWIDTTGL